MLSLRLTPELLLSLYPLELLEKGRVLEAEGPELVGEVRLLLVMMAPGHLDTRPRHP